MAFRRLGIEVESVKCMFSTIGAMEHHTRTAYGTSTRTYSSAGRLIPFQGVFQGNSAGPVIWSVVSTPLLNMARTARYGANLLTTISKAPSRFVGYAFVDDTN